MNETYVWCLRNCFASITIYKYILSENNEEKYFRIVLSRTNGRWIDTIENIIGSYVIQSTK